jgi:chromosome segregation ATPase
MTEPRTSWLQRLVGGDDSATLASLEEQVARAKEEAQTLRQQLEQERDKVAARDVQLEQAEAQALAAEQDFATRLADVRASVEAKLEAGKVAEQEHQKTVSELEAVRAMVRRMTDEKNKQSASITRLRDESAKLTKASAAANQQAQDARARVEELERASEALTKELADSKRRLQAIETRASTVEHELGQTKQAQLTAEAHANELEALTKQHAEQQQKLTRVEEELRSTSVHLSGARAQRDVALAMANDLWTALERTVGEAAPLALVMGVELGKVERSANLTDATSALKRSLEERALCQGIKVEPLDDGLTVELRALQVPRTGAAPHWLAASATRFLERAAGLDLAIESSAIDRDTLKLRLRTPLGARAVS